MIDKAKIIDVFRKEERGLCGGTLCETSIAQNSHRFLGCAAGALLFHAGMKPEELFQLEAALVPPEELFCKTTGLIVEECDECDFCEYDWKTDPESAEHKARQLLNKTYGLDDWSIDAIIRENDSYHAGMLERRDNMIRFVQEEL